MQLCPIDIKDDTGRSVVSPFKRLIAIQEGLNPVDQIVVTEAMKLLPEPNENDEWPSSLP